ncbi:MAG TPA: DUF4332 domain-containing protein [Rhizomicrobium sp.]
MGTKLVNLETLDPADLQKLETAGISHTDELFARAAGKAERVVLAGRTGIALPVLDQFVGVADLMRIAGIGEPHALLLAALEIPTAAALSACEAAVLIKQMRRKNVEILVVRGMPPESTVARWVEDARKLPPGAEI